MLLGYSSPKRPKNAPKQSTSNIMYFAIPSCSSFNPAFFTPITVFKGIQQYLRPDISRTALLPFERPWPRFLHHTSWGTIPGNCSLEKFLGTMPSSSWEQKFIGVAQTAERRSCREFLEQNLMMWSTMRVCTTFPGTKAQAFANQGHPTTSAMTGQRQFWGPNRTSKSFLGVWDFWLCGLCLFDDISYCREGVGNFNPNQATSTMFMRTIQQSCKCSKLISMCTWETISCLSPHSHRHP